MGAAISSMVKDPRSLVEWFERYKKKYPWARRTGRYKYTNARHKKCTACMKRARSVHNRLARAKKMCKPCHDEIFGRKFG